MARDQRAHVVALPGRDRALLGGAERRAVALVRTCAGLGPRFSADELSAVRGGGDLAARLAWLVQGGVLAESHGGYRFRDGAIQDAIYDHALDERDLVHERAFRYWLERPGADAIDRLTRLAYHGAGAREPVTAVTCWIALARAARDRGDTDIAEEVLARARGCLQSAGPPARHLAAALAEVLGEPRVATDGAQAPQRPSRRSPP